MRPRSIVGGALENADCIVLYKHYYLFFVIHETPN